MENEMQTINQDRLLVNQRVQNVNKALTYWKSLAQSQQTKAYAPPSQIRAEFFNSNYANQKS